MAHMVESLAFRQANGYPWHRIGEGIEGKHTATQLMGKAKMLYDVRMIPLFADMPDGSRIASGDGLIVEDRTGEWTTLGTVKKCANYNIVTNGQIAETLDTPYGGLPALSEMLEVDTAGVLNGGLYTFISLFMGKDTVKIGVDGEDQYEAWAMILNNFSGSGTLQWSMAVTRPVCRNTVFLSLQQAEEAGTLWTFSHRGDPLTMLKYRTALEQQMQDARRTFYKQLEAMALNNWEEKDVDKFALALYPDPSEPTKINQAKAGIGYDIPEDIFKPVEAMGKAAETKYAQDLERMDSYRKALSGLTYQYAEEFGALTKYSAYQAGTDFINWRTPERGGWDQAGESVMIPGQSRRIEMDRFTKIMGLTKSPRKSKITVLD